MKKKLTIYCLIMMSIVILTGCKQTEGISAEDAGANLLKKDIKVFDSVEGTKKIEVEGVLKK